MTTTPVPTASANLGNPMQPQVASVANLTRNSRAERARMPVALHVAEDVAIANGVLRPPHHPARHRHPHR